MCFKTKVSLLLLVLFIGAGVFSMNVKPAEAASLAELQQIIDELKARILELQERLTAVQQGQEDPGEWCHDFNTNLRYKDTGAEVIVLQTALKKQGFTEVSKDASGNFGTGTFSAVVYFQEKYAKDILSYWGLNRGTGFVGKSTRAKLNEFYGCGITPVPECTIGDEKKHTCPDGTQVPWCTCVDGVRGIGTGPGWECVDSPENLCTSSTNCTDSDGGINKYVKGTTCRDSYSIDTPSSFSPDRFCRTDRCYSYNPKLFDIPSGADSSEKFWLLEYYCSNGKIFSKAMYCENGCVNGACIKEIGTLTCKEECQAKGYVTGICRSWSVVPDAEWGCKDNELNIGQTSDCSVPFGLVGASKTCCCQKEAQEDCRDENYECTISDIPCCPGLKEVPYAFVGPDGSCIAATCGSICRPCGNGVCDANENKCNCPEDCGEGDENLPPVIDGLTAPTQLKVNEKGVWTIKARDPENGVLSYSVNWGDEYGQIVLPGSAELDAGSQTTTFTHSYSQVGTYTIKFIVTDDHQQTANTSASVNVGVSEITCTDSDGGIRKYVRGRTCRDLYSVDPSPEMDSAGINSAKRFCRTDMCYPYNPELLDSASATSNNYSSDNTWLKEYYCSNNKIFSKTLYCENGCENGACIKAVEDCLNEGETYMPGEDKQCCAGLEAITRTQGDGTTCTIPMGYVCASSVCGDGKCEGNYENVCSCPEDCEEKECTLGDEKKYTCPDGTQVPWCICVDEARGIGTGVGWECVDSPENACSVGDKIIRVDFPNGGKLTKGETYGITWILGSLSAPYINDDSKVGITLIDYSRQVCSTSGVCGYWQYNIAWGLSASSCEHYWTVPESNDLVKLGDKYKVKIGFINEYAQMDVYDESDNYFSIVEAGEDCLKEGQTYMPGEDKQCCAGLEAITRTQGDGTTCTIPMGYVCASSVCGDGKCEGNYENVCSCPEDCEEKECTLGDEKKYTCPDGTQVPWCICVDEARGIGTGVGWECVDSPENACSVGDKIIRVDFPNGGKLTKGETYGITWILGSLSAPYINDDSKVGITLIDYSRQVCSTSGVCGYWQYNIAWGLSASSCEHYWTVPESNDLVKLGDKYKVKIGFINEYAQMDVYDESDNYFSIVEAGEDCLKEGQTYMPGEDKQCCAGLEAITRTQGDGTTCTIPMGYVCASSVCGDGKCEGNYENVCSCPEDCQIYASSLWNWDYCLPDSKCNANEGDCDSDADCAEGLFCAKNVGANYGQDSRIDVCEKAQ